VGVFSELLHPDNNTMLTKASRATTGYSFFIPQHFQGMPRLEQA